jgi:hypothetical protein
MSESNEQHRREMIERVVKQQGFSIQSWGEGEDGVYASLGRVRILEDDDNEGLLADTEGELSASVVGAAHFGNERVAFHYTEDGMDEMTGEVRDPSMQVEVID